MDCVLAVESAGFGDGLGPGAEGTGGSGNGSLPSLSRDANTRRVRGEDSS